MLEAILHKFGGTRSKKLFYISNTLFATLGLPVETFLPKDVQMAFFLSPKRLFVLSLYEEEAQKVRHYIAFHSTRYSN
jgi:hypothetical protein